MKPLASVVNEDRGVVTVSVAFCPSSYKETEALAYDIGEEAIKAWRNMTTRLSAEDIPAPSVGSLFEAKKIVLAKEIDGEIRVKLEDGTLIAFESKAPYKELRRKIPEALEMKGTTHGPSRTGRTDDKAAVHEPSAPDKGNCGHAGVEAGAAPSGNYLFAAVESLTDLIDECFAECERDEAKAMEMLESLNDKHPVLKAANQKTWRDRAQRRMKVLALREQFPTGG